MKNELMEILVCPACKGKLELEVIDEKATEIWGGLLTCVSCHRNYPIRDSIPNLLPPDDVTTLRT